MTSWESASGSVIRFSSGLRLNISSIRSVTRKPPTTFTVAKTTATCERLLEPRVREPAISIAPTSTIPWIAFVPDMSGVEQRRDARDQLEAEKDGQREDRQVGDQGRARRHRLLQEPDLRGRRTVPRTISSSKSSSSALSLTSSARKLVMFREYIWEARTGTCSAG